MNQLERKAAKDAENEGPYESSEPTSMTNSSTVEGEHTIQNPESDDATGDNSSLSEKDDDGPPSDSSGRRNKMGEAETMTPIVSDTTSSSATTPGAESSAADLIKEFGKTDVRSEDEIQLLQLKLQEAQCRNMVIEAEMNELKARVKTS